MGGTSAPTPFARYAATGNKSVGTEVPPQQPKHRNPSRSTAYLRCAYSTPGSDDSLPSRFDNWP
ncbi:DUF6053 domain-containing protein [Lysobacter enzymogenes]|uniref:DUF6053 domain-containing protein n=1 Tax=Lysobacter enzymogenes TaxID=69 RepID=UPI003D18EC5E